MGTFEKVMNFVLTWEGGYVNDPNDPGGETNFGISKRSFPDTDIKNLTKEGALEIYREYFWNPIKGDERPYPEALAIMDFAVHSGPDTALGFWENAHSVREYVILRTDYLRIIKNNQGQYLFNIYGRGWMARINALHRKLNEADAYPDVALMQVFYGAKVIEFEPVKTTVGQTNSGRTKIMVRV